MATKKIITKEQVNYIIEKYRIRIGSFTIREDGFIDVKGSVSIIENRIFKLPIKFGTVTGDFNCKGNGLKTLKGSPKFVGGSFNCSDNELTSLNNGPDYVGGSYFCQENNLVTLKGCSIEIVGRFNCALNKLTSLKYGPKRVGKSYFANHNKLVSLLGSPIHIGGSFHAEANLLSDLSNCPDYIGNCFHFDFWIPSLHMGMKNCYVGDIKIELLERISDHDTTSLPELILRNQKYLPIIFKYNRYLQIYDHQGHISYNNLDDILFEINNGMR